MIMENKDKYLGSMLIMFGVFLFFSLFYFDVNEPVTTSANAVTHPIGFIGLWVSHLLIRKTIGYASYIFPLLALGWGIYFFLKRYFRFLWRSSLYALGLALLVSVFWAIIKFPDNVAPDQVLSVCGQPPWGFIGGFGQLILQNLFGEILTILLLIVGLVLLVLKYFDLGISQIVNSIRKAFDSLLQSLPFGTKAQNAGRMGRVNTGKGFPGVDRYGSDMDTERVNAEPPPSSSVLTDSDMDDYRGIPDEETPQRRPGKKSTSAGTGVYLLPPASILDESVNEDDEVHWDEHMPGAETLEEKLQDFGITGKVINIKPGPVITRYEIEPAPGVKVSRFTSLSDDLALVMRAKRIRVVAPIPGKAAIGIEIPNRNPRIVSLKGIIESNEFQGSDFKLPLALGKTISGKAFVADLVTMPHLLIAGATGSGKSVCLHSIIASILFKAKPDEVQVALIDPKRLELSPYSALKNHHLVYREDSKEAVVTTSSNAVLLLKSLEREMERRYELLARAGVRNISDYNIWMKTVQPEGDDGDAPEKLPYLVLIIDELADLMLTAAREVEEPIARLTQMSRAVGIHLIVATQRPSVDVITGVIKANFPARMAFQVATKTDSRTILDYNGAEKLLGRGDMLFLPPGSPEPVRIHNAFISLEEVQRLIEHIKVQPVPDAKTKLLTEEDLMEADEFGGYAQDRDELFNEALKLVVRHQQGSSSLLQRRLKIGYTRAARIIDQLEDAGYVGPFDGSKAREVLTDEDELRDLGLI